MANYQYRITSVGQSSHHYGNCEVCGKYVSEVFYQVESVEYESGRFTYYQCQNYFGHKDCLLSKRRPTQRAADGAECVCENHTDNDGWRCNVCGLLSPHRR